HLIIRRTATTTCFPDTTLFRSANSLLYGLGLLDENFEPAVDAPEEPLSIELFAGSLDDNNAHLFWEGAIDTLQPYLDDGTLEVPDRKSTRLNSSHVSISYAVFC